VNKLNKTIGFIGGGQMGEAILGGLINAGLFEASDIYVMDILSSRLLYLNTKYSITNSSSDTTKGYNYLVENCDIIVFSIKPQSLQEVLHYVENLKWTEKHLVISIVGGAKTSTIEKCLKKVPVIRVIPNTPMLVGIGASGVARGTYATSEDAEFVHSLFSCLGVSFIVSENLIDSITSVSGCGPAYVYMMIEAMADGGVDMGLPREISQTLAAQTVMGAAKMVLETREHPGKLKDKVCSPGGSTIAGVKALEQGKFRGTIINAIEAGKIRMEEVGKKID